MQILPSLNKHRVSIVLLILTTIILGLTIYKPSYDKADSVSVLEFQPNISITPNLSIDRFAPYTISASNVPETPTTVSLELSVENGDNTPCWDYNVDGSCASQPITLPMTYSSENMQWSNTRIYPDYIYPEIFFASSTITWNNTPLNTSVRRNDYHILHMENPFTMVGDMSFWIELNAVPVSTTNSADLLVYLVEGESKDIDDITFFNSDWTKNPSVGIFL